MGSQAEPILLIVGGEEGRTAALGDVVEVEENHQLE